MKPSVASIALSLMLFETLASSTLGGVGPGPAAAPRGASPSGTGGHDFDPNAEKSVAPGEMETNVDGVTVLNTTQNCPPAKTCRIIIKHCNGVADQNPPHNPHAYVVFEVEADGLVKDLDNGNLELPGGNDASLQDSDSNDIDFKKGGSAGSLDGSGNNNDIDLNYTGSSVNVSGNGNQVHN